jgi:putative ABC transport system substrate-binding protein
MRRREFITLLGGAVAASSVSCPLAARAQQAERMRRIGVLMAAAENDLQGKANLSGFRQGLAELGWAEGRNVRMDFVGLLPALTRCGPLRKNWSTYNPT